MIVGTGDNPSTLAGLGVSVGGDRSEGAACVSLGTSDTFMGITSSPKPSELGHVMPHPTDPDQYFVMLVNVSTWLHKSCDELVCWPLMQCYKNGAPARQAVNTRYCGGDWTTFSRQVETTAPGCNGFINLTAVLPGENSSLVSVER